VRPCLIAEERRRVAADHLLDDPVRVDLRNGRLCDQPAVAQHRDEVAELDHLLETMRDVDDRDAVVDESTDDPEETLDLARRKRRGGLVHDQHAHLLRERLADRDHLLGPDRQIAQKRARVPALAEPLQQP